MCSNPENFVISQTQDNIEFDHKIEVKIKAKIFQTGNVIDFANNFFEIYAYISEEGKSNEKEPIKPFFSKSQEKLSIYEIKTRLSIKLDPRFVYYQMTREIENQNRTIKIVRQNLGPFNEKEKSLVIDQLSKS